jgi:hypothetical protein
MNREKRRIFAKVPKEGNKNSRLVSSQPAKKVSELFKEQLFGGAVNGESPLHW